MKPARSPCSRTGRFYIHGSGTGWRPLSTPIALRREVLRPNVPGVATAISSRARMELLGYAGGRWRCRGARMELLGHAGDCWRSCGAWMELRRDASGRRGTRVKFRRRTSGCRRWCGTWMELRRRAGGRRRWCWAGMEPRGYTRSYSVHYYEPGRRTRLSSDGLRQRAALT